MIEEESDLTNEQFAQVREATLGVHFGYPACCIAAFIETNGAAGNPLGGTVDEGTGFIPCPEHAQEIIDGKTTLKNLIEEREHSVPFPNDNLEEALASIGEELTEEDRTDEAYLKAMFLDFLLVQGLAEWDRYETLVVDFNKFLDANFLKDSDD